uniref:Uncharacterized protein n=1 Tax=Cucumis melo TaxID=3656 RepID=A0A9I9EE26_CUCME
MLPLHLLSSLNKPVSQGLDLLNAQNPRLHPGNVYRFLDLINYTLYKIVGKNSIAHRQNNSIMEIIKSVRRVS